MKQLHEMLKTINICPQYEQAIRFARPLNDHFGINHFYYYQIDFSGKYASFGTHRAFQEHCLNVGMVDHFNTLRHPSVIPTGISLFKTYEDEKLKKVLDMS